MRKKYLTKSALAIALALQAAAPQLSQANQILEEIVVNARKVDESAQDIPVSISAFTGDLLEIRGVEEIGDLSNITPNLEIGQGATGPTGGNFSIRGQSNQDLTILSDLAIGVYIDGVVFPRGQALSQDFFDVARVEVLKGPQGTLYGRNTSGGAISVYSNEPEMNEFNGSAAVSLGNYDLVKATGVINIPLVDDTLAARIALKTTDRDGYQNVTTRNLFDPTDPGTTTDGNDADAEAFRASLLWTPSDLTSVKLVADYSEYEQTGAPGRLVFLQPTGNPIPFSLANFASLFGLTDADLVPSNFHDGNANNGLPGAFGLNSNGTSGMYGDGEFWGLNLTVEHEFENFNFRSITGYREYDSSNSGDLDASIVNMIHTNNVSLSDSFSQEFNFFGSAYDGKLDWLAGVYYFVEEGEELQLTQFFGGPRPGRLQVAKNQSQALFAQGTWHFNDQWSSTVGLRYTKDDRELTRFAERTTFDFNPGAVLFDEPDEDWSNVSYTIGVDYKVNEDVLLYLKTSTGYRSGGFDNRTPGSVFEEETVEDIELGMKGDFLDGQLRVNAALFQTDYQDQQLSAIIITGTPPRPTTVVSNVGESTINGAELELTYAVSDNLTFLLSGGWIDAEFDEYIVDGEDLSDQPFPFTPELTYNIGASYVQPLDQGDLSFYLNYGWRDEINYENGVNDLEPSRSLVDGRISFSPSSEKYEVSIWGSNLTDEEYHNRLLPFQTGAGNFGFTVAFAGAPRTYGVDFKYNF